MNTIVYLHGFRSAPASVKATTLAAAVADLPPAVRPRLHVPYLNDGPRANIVATMQWIDANVRDPRAALTIVGSSLGGFYATFLAERYGARAVVINPAVRPYVDLRPYAGAQANLYTGEVFVVTEAHFDELRVLAVPSLREPRRFWLMVQTGDEVLDYREAVAFYAGAHQLVVGGGDHAFRGFAEQVPAILRFAGVEIS